MIQFLTIFFEDVYEYIENENEKMDYLVLKQQKLKFISVMNNFEMQVFYLFVLKTVYLIQN